MAEDDAHTAALPDLDGLRALLGIDRSGSPTLRARQTVALIRHHPHVPWNPGETDHERLGALLVSSLALALRGTGWQGLLAQEMTGHGPKGPDQCLAERARLAGWSTAQLITALRPLLDLFDDPTLTFEYAAEHTKILFPVFYECAELWSAVFNEHTEDASRAANEDRATRRVLDSLTDSAPPPDEVAHRIGQFRELQAALAADGSSPLLDDLRVSDAPSQGWPTWTGVVADHLETIHRDHTAAQPPHEPWIAPDLASAPHHPTATAPRPSPSPMHVPSALAQLLEACDDEPIDPTTQRPNIGLTHYLRNGFRYWHLWGTYSQLYDALLASDRAGSLARYVYDYLYIGYDTGPESLLVPEITELPMSGWEIRALFPELRALLAIRHARLVDHTDSLVDSFARTRMPSAIGLAPLIGEIAELLALCTTDTDLTYAMTHLGGTQPPQSWRTWLTDLSSDAITR
jgi:hypothetical protein